jgi:hypothetical protein
MARRVEFVSYRPRTILNKHKRPDHWFWTRYTAYPYEGCQHRCLFFHCRERKYCPFDDVNDFGYVIQVKENAPDLLRRALSRAPVDLLGTGEPNHRVWAYRKAAWAIEDTPQDLGLIYRSMGRKGLESIENVGPSMAKVIEALLSPRR